LQAANVLNSDRAILMGNRIIEIFVKMHNMLSSHQEILEKIEELEKKDLEQDDKIMLIFEYIKQFEETKRQQSEQVDRKQIGFNIDKEA
jgi:hypothetical protein